MVRTHLTKEGSEKTKKKNFKYATSQDSIEEPRGWKRIQIPH